MSEHDAKSDKETRRFRLPKLFADHSDEAGATPEEKAEAVAARAQMLGVTLPEAVPTDVIARANRPYEGAPRATVIAADEVAAMGTSLNHVVNQTGAAPEELEEVAARIDDLHTLLAEINNRGLAQDKVFDTLHNELQDYKNDFIYEHLKPVVRPLLFLYDSMEQFDEEMQNIERRIPQGMIINGIPPGTVSQNVQFFREQLIEALRICEVTPMQTPEGRYDPRLHKPIDTVPVPPEQEGEVQRVVRSGWFLNGRVFRPAEVVVGKVRAGAETSGDTQTGGKRG